MWSISGILKNNERAIRWWFPLREIVGAEIGAEKIVKFKALNEFFFCALAYRNYINFMIFETNNPQSIFIILRPFP